MSISPPTSIRRARAFGNCPGSARARPASARAISTPDFTLKEIPCCLQARKSSSLVVPPALVLRPPRWRSARSLTLVSGFLSVRPRPNSAIVSAANGALESLARALALELAPVRVNAVSPGIIDTPIRAAMPEEARREMLAKTAAALPVGRVGVGEDIARQILSLMANGFATGSIVYIDGGALVT